MYGLLKAAAEAPALQAVSVVDHNTQDASRLMPPYPPGTDIGDSSTGNPWSKHYANHNDWNTYLGESVEKNMEAAGYPNQGKRPGKGTSFQGGYKPGFGKAITQSVRDAIRTSNATVPAKLDALHKAQGDFIEDARNFAHNPYGMGNLQVQGTGKTLGEVSQGWKPVDADTYGVYSAGRIAGKPLGRHTPVQNQFGMTGLRSDQKAQAPQVRR